MSADKNIIRAEHVRNFTQIDNETLRNTNMSLQAKGLLAWALSQGNNFVFTRKGIVKLTGYGKDRIAVIIKELLSLGHCQPGPNNNLIFIEKPISKRGSEIPTHANIGGSEIPSQGGSEIPSLSNSIVNNNNIYRDENLKNSKKPTIEERKQEFFNDVMQHKNTYPETMLREFLNYWGETKANKTMKFEMEKTWETHRRLRTWSANAQKFKPANNGNHKPGSWEGRKAVELMN